MPEIYPTTLHWGPEAPWRLPSQRRLRGAELRGWDLRLEAGLLGDLLPDEGLDRGLDGNLDSVLRGGLEKEAKRGPNALHVRVAEQMEICRRGSG